MKAEKTCNGGQWTAARKRQFIFNGLRQLHTKWGPACQALKDARVRRGVYLCAGCKEEVPATSIFGTYKTGPKAGKPKKVKVAKDHIRPVVDPIEGFVGYDEYIERIFVEKEGYAILCPRCHNTKTLEENAVRKEAKRQGKNGVSDNQ